jgi:hypothetical protein
MQSEFVNILDDIEASSYQPEIKAKLEKATMLLWSLQDVKNGGSGVVNWNGMEIIPDSTITPAPIAPIEVVPEVVIQEEPKEIKPKKKKEKVEFDLQKDLNINIDEINFDDLLQGF